MIGGVVNRFSNGLGCHMPCESLVGFSGNWDPFKGTLQLPHVDPFGSGHDSARGQEGFYRPNALQGKRGPMGRVVLGDECSMGQVVLRDEWSYRTSALRGEWSYTHC